MTTPGDDTPDPADGEESAATAGPARKGRRAVLVLVTVAAVFTVLGLVAVLIGQSHDETSLLDPDAPGLSHFTMHTGGKCTYEPDRGGLVAHFDVSSPDAGRFTVDLEAVTDEGADNLDISTTHVVRFTVPFYGGQTRKQFDVVVPLTEADYQHGYRQCRYTAPNAMD
jgi:hypothetical protein